MKSYIGEEIKSNSSVINNEGIPMDDWNVTKMCNIWYSKNLNCHKGAKYAKYNEEIQSLYTFEEYYRKGKIDYRKAIYINHIEIFLNYIRRENFFIFNADQLFNNDSMTVMSKLSQFLGIEDIYVNFTDKFPQYNMALVETDFSCEARKKLYPIYQPATDRLYKYMEESQKIYNHEPKFTKFKDYKC